MSNSEVNKSQKSKWAWADLWKKLHFGHLSGGENWAGMEAAYRFGLGPYRKFVVKAISARIERKNLLTFGIEFPPVHEQPVRLKLSPRACIIVVKSTGETKQVIRDWPDDVEMDSGIKIYDEDSEEYFSIQSFHSRGESNVSIEVDAELIGRNNLLVKGRPIRVIAESENILPETIQIAEVNYTVLEAKTSISGEEHELLVPLHQSEFKQSQVNDVNVISVRKWKPKQGTQLLDGSKVLVDSWTGQTDMTIKSAPTVNELLTSEGIRIPWKKVEQDGVWVKPFVDVDSDAVIDPMDTLFEDKDIRKLQAKKGREDFSILERNREAQMIRLSSEPHAKELTLPIGTGDLMNQKAAIERLQAAPLAHHIPLMELTTRLDHNYLKAWESFKPSNTPIVPWLTRVGSGAEGSEEQRRFVLKALSTPDFAFLEGPPGSGKTETIGELILQLLSDTNNDYRILLCGSTQASIDNVLSRFGENDLVQPLRIVNSKRWRNNPEDRDNLVYDSEIHRWTEPEQVDDLRQRLGDAGKDFTDANLSEIVLHRSNLVCATIGGVSQHPSIKQVLQKDSQVPPKAIFDVLIIDEASKTTFTEFLIPAIFCRKWILVGDVAQLPPFSDQADIAGMLDLLESDDNIPPASLRKACLNIQSVIDDRHLRKIPRLLIESSETVLAMEMEWRARKIRGEKTLQDNMVDEVRAAFISPLVSKWDGEGMLCIDTSSLKPSNWEEIGRNRLKLMDCELIVISESDAKQFSLSMLPSTHLTPGMMSNKTSPSKILPTRFQFRLSLERQRLMMKTEGGDRRRDPFKMNHGLNGESTSWGRQVAWRIQRVYEMQTSENTDLRDKYLNQVKTLLPAASNQENWAKEVELIRCFSLPSVLESLQHGFMGREGKGAASDELAPRFPTTLSLGFPSESKRTRFESIKHQHRMHWSISRFPREEFYAPEDQDDDWRLLDAEQTLHSRNNFKFILNNSNTQLPQQQRRFWIDVKEQQTDKGNPAEAKRAAEILEDLIEWFESEEEVERVSLTVALLSPYVNQSRTLRVEANSILQKKSNTMKGNRGTIHLSHGRKITVYCSTVDKFQGQEADVVLLSLRNTTKQGNIDSPNRANVALTRAREALFIIGNKSNYSKAYDPMLKRLATGTEAGNNNTYWRRTK